MPLTRKQKLLRKLSVLKKGAVTADCVPGAKTKDERKKFWSEMMETADRPGDRLKASELLGRSEADFTDKLGVGAIGDDGEITEIPIIFVKPQPHKVLELERGISNNGTDY